MTAYTTPEELRAIIGKVATEDVEVMETLIDSVSEAIDRICNRPIGGFVASDTPSTRLFAGSGRSFMRIDEAVEIVSVSAKENATDSTYTLWDAEDWVAFSGDYRTPDFNRTPYTQLMATANNQKRFAQPWANDDLSWGQTSSLDRFASRRNVPRTPTVSISARWGYADTVPGNIRYACVIWCARLWKRGKSAFASMIVNSESGQLIYRVGEDPDITAMLRNARMIRVPV